MAGKAWQRALLACLIVVDESAHPRSGAATDYVDMETDGHTEYIEKLCRAIPILWGRGHTKYLYSSGSDICRLF